MKALWEHSALLVDLGIRDKVSRVAQVQATTNTEIAGKGCIYS